RLISARIDAVAGSPAQRREAVKRLNAVAQQAKAAQFVNAAWEARLALGEMGLKSGNSMPAFCTISRKPWLEASSCKPSRCMRPAMEFPVLCSILLNARRA